MFWPMLLATLMSIPLGASGKFGTLAFSLGAIIGSVIWGIVNFSSWAQLSVILTVLQVFPTFIAILGFGIGHVFSPVQNT